MSCSASTGNGSINSWMQKKESSKKKKATYATGAICVTQRLVKRQSKKETEETASYSVKESLSQKDFSAVPENEVAELMKCIRSLSRRLAAKANRRYELSK